jgi:hypothetical protein
MIPEVVGAVAQTGGGYVAFVTSDEYGDERAFSLRSWDASPAIPLGPGQGGPLWLSATRVGVYANDGTNLRFAPWGGSLEPTTRPLPDAVNVIPSPSGKRLFVDFGRMPSDTAHNPWPCIIDSSTHRILYEWRGSPNTGGGLAWLSQTRLLFDSEPYGESSGPIMEAELGGKGHITFKDTGLVGQFPSPSPDGRMWAYADASGRLVLYDPAARRELAGWAAPSHQEGAAEAVAWADGAHVLYLDDRLWVVDVSAIRAK